MSTSSQPLSTSEARPLRKRVEWIDYAKVFALYLMVVAHHVTAVDSRVTMWIYSFHMPLFFFFSGVLYTPRSLKDTLLKDFRALIVPFLIINAICLLGNLLVSRFWLHAPLPDSAQFLKIIGVSLIGMGDTLEEGVRPACVYLWFFVALFIIHLLASLGYRRIKAWVVIVSLVCVIFVATIMTPQVYNAPFSALMAFPFFAAGFLAKGLKNFDIKWTWALLACIVAAVPHFFLSQTNGDRIDVNGLVYGDHVALFYITAFLGIVMAAGLAVVITSISPNGVKRCMFDLAAGAVVVLGFQDFAMLFSSKLISMCKESMGDTTMLVFGASIVIMVAFVLVIRLCRRYFPAILGGR